MHLLLSLLSLVVAVVQVVVVVVVVVMVLVPVVVVVVKSCTGKYKLGAIAGVRVGKCNLETRAGKFKVSVGVDNGGWGPGLVDTDSGGQARAGEC